MDGDTLGVVSNKPRHPTGPVKYNRFTVSPAREAAGEAHVGRLAGRAAIVTGGAKGIGRHYVQKLAAEGAGVMIADIVDGADLAEEIAQRHGRNAAASAICDVSSEETVRGLVARTID